MKYKIERKIKQFKQWLIKSLCTKEEWKTLRMVRAGYYNPISVETTFDVSIQDYALLKSNENRGYKYDERFSVTRRLLRDCENVIKEYVDYGCAYDMDMGRYVYSAELKLMKGVIEE